MGMSMKVKKSTVEDIKARLATTKNKKEEKQKQYDMEERMKEIQEEARLNSILPTWMYHIKRLSRDRNVESKNTKNKNGVI